MLQQLKLPVITREIASYLNTNDAYHLAQSCKVIHSDLSLTTLLPLKICEDRCWQNTGDIPRCGPKIPLVYGARRTHSVEIQCKWKDQGWGNRKGQLFIVGQPEHLSQVYGMTGYAGFVHGYKVCTSRIADHVSTNLFMSFTPREGMYYCVWYVVGGGGGHELKVSELAVTCTIVGIDDYDGDGTRNKYRAETYEKLVKEGVFMDLFKPRQNSLFYITLLKSLAQSFRVNGVVDPILASWFQSNCISLEEGSLVALEELASFLITGVEDEEYCHNSVDYDNDEDEMLRHEHDLDHDDEVEMDHHDNEDWQDSDESDDEDSEDDDDLSEMGYA
jgi:hypothetical protein